MFYQVFFHVLGLNRMITGRISSLPTIIVKLKITLENMLYAAKLEYGPTASIPGPMFEIHESDALKFVGKP